MKYKSLKIGLIFPLAFLLNAALANPIKTCGDLAGSDWDGHVSTSNGAAIIDVQINSVSGATPNQSISGTVRLFVGSEDNSYRIDPRASNCHIIGNADNTHSLSLLIQTIDDYINIRSEGTITAPFDAIPVAIEIHLPRTGINAAPADTTLTKREADIRIKHY